MRNREGWAIVAYKCRECGSIIAYFVFPPEGQGDAGTGSRFAHRWLPAVCPYCGRALPRPRVDDVKIMPLREAMEKMREVVDLLEEKG